MLSSLLAGFALGLSLIVAIGAQNLFVLRQGVRREHALVVAAVCVISDSALIAVGVSGMGALLQAVPWLLDAARWGGAVFLLGYAAMAARRALRPTGASAQADADALQATAGGTPTASTRARLGAVVLTCLALTWLNPHVYLDTVFLLGSVAGTHGDERWWFAAGAMIASMAWFFALASGAAYLSRWLSTPRAWRILDAVVAVLMCAIAVSLLVPAVAW